MRGILVAVICWVGCLALHFGVGIPDGGAPAVVRTNSEVAAFSVDGTSADRWLCESRCNSDLNLPQSVHGIAPTPSAQRVASGQQVAVHPAVGGRAVRPMPHVGFFSKLEHHPAVTRMADYYVYRLRRLLI